MMYVTSIVKTLVETSNWTLIFGYFINPFQKIKILSFLDLPSYESIFYMDYGAT
jgi:hypothetical protein